MKINSFSEIRVISEENIFGICSNNALFCTYIILYILANFRVIFIGLVHLSETRNEMSINVVLMRISLISVGILACILITIANILILFRLKDFNGFQILEIVV